ncbi:MAG: N-acetylmuramoyl-L-alanine amidase [Opitutaceae bacterium]
MAACLFEGMLRVFPVICLFFLGALLIADEVSEVSSGATDLAYALSTRYAPYADWAKVLDVELLAAHEVTSYWRTAEVIRSTRGEGALPLSGLHLALDPGHIGGKWAASEGRDFVIADGDFRVREGELVLEVAQRVRAQLEALGAEVTLLRESLEPINTKTPLDYLEQAQRDVPPPKDASVDAFTDYGLALRNRTIHLAGVTGEIIERARVVNEDLKPDALISLHINAAPWPVVAEGSPSESECDTNALSEEGEVAAKSRLQLVNSNHVHVLIFGCLSAAELGSPHQQERFIKKLLNGSAAEERALGRALAGALIDATQLPASLYDGQNAIRLDADAPAVWARNLMLLRMVECPTVLLEPYIANSKQVYARIQEALAARARDCELPEDDILIEYTNAVVAGVLQMYE